jgi:hypothetical protein
MATAHGDWLAALFGGLGEGEIETIMGLLGKTKFSARAAIARASLEEEAG